MKLAGFPRFRLGDLPTPLEPVNSLSRLLGGPNLRIKRDDAYRLSRNVLVSGGSNPIGALGCVGCATELAKQANGPVACIQGGRTQTPMVGIRVRAPRMTQQGKVFQLAQRTAVNDMAGLIHPVRNGRWKKGDDVLFLNDWGTVGLHGDRSAFAGLRAVRA